VKRSEKADVEDYVRMRNTPFTHDPPTKIDVK